MSINRIHLTVKSVTIFAIRKNRAPFYVSMRALCKEKPCSHIGIKLYCFL